MRWTQNVHFSITPWPRTVTSGFSIRPHRLGPALDLVVEVVEAADLVGAVVRAVARADAAVVDHRRSGPRACGRSRSPDRPARRAPRRTAGRASARWRTSTSPSFSRSRAAGARRRRRRRRRRRSARCAARTSARLREHLLLADDRDVVLDVAGDDAGAAARAAVEVDRHAPAVGARRGARRSPGRSGGPADLVAAVAVLRGLAVRAVAARAGVAGHAATRAPTRERDGGRARRAALVVACTASSASRAVAPGRRRRGACVGEPGAPAAPRR